MKKQIKIGLLILGTILLVTLLIFSIQRYSKNLNENKIESKEGVERMENQKIIIKVNNHELTATLYNNTSTKALIKELESAPITIEMEDYANMEKVGNLGVSLPRNDQNITTEAGDLILYQGNNFVIYYDNNNWSLTRLGKIDNITGQELKEILGKGNVTVELSLKNINAQAD